MQRETDHELSEGPNTPGHPRQVPATLALQCSGTFAQPVIRVAACGRGGRAIGFPTRRAPSIQQHAGSVCVGTEWSTVAGVVTRANRPPEQGASPYRVPHRQERHRAGGYEVTAADL